MNREIKFRVWDLDGGAMFNWESCRETQLLDDSFDNKRAVAMQFTGLKDKNGKDIYEGDILDARVQDECISDLSKWKYKLIVFFSDKGSWEAKEKMDQFSGSVFPFHNDHYEILLNKTKVIGNIFENPELLNEKRT